MTSIEGLIKEATPLLVAAVEHDRAKRPNDALTGYKHGIELLVNATRMMSVDDPRKEGINRNIANYLNRAEELDRDTNIQVRVVEQRRIKADETGHGYDKIFGKCLDNDLTAVRVQDAYIVAHHQMLNFVRFCELVVSRAKNVRLITLVTGEDGRSNDAGFAELSKSLEARKIKLTVKFQAQLHDREIKFNNGWVVKIGRGLDYFKRVDRYALGACDLNLKPCHETTIDIYRQKVDC